jgi:hypothetical protein
MVSALFQTLWQPQTYPKWVSVDLEVWQLGHFGGGRYNIVMPNPKAAFYSKFRYKFAFLIRQHLCF